MLRTCARPERCSPLPSRRQTQAQPSADAMACKENAGRFRLYLIILLSILLAQSLSHRSMTFSAGAGGLVRAFLAAGPDGGMP